MSRYSASAASATAIAAGPAKTNVVTLHSVTTGNSATFSLEGELQRGEPAWANYVRGVIAGFQKRNLTIKGFNAVIESDLPLAGGLSSSAALEVATATLLETMTGQPLDLLPKAELCQQAEHEFAGVPCGIMDQFVAVHGRKDHLLLIDCQARKVNLVPFTDPTVAALIINTQVRHTLADGEYGRRRAQCETAARAMNLAFLREASVESLNQARSGMETQVFQRARHVVTENHRTQEVARLIPLGDWEAVGQLMYASHASLRDDYEVSCAELDLVVELARQMGIAGGVYGCRMTGGGFGGCAVALVRTDQARKIAETISEAYLAEARNYASVFLSRPGAGASLTTYSQSPGE